jgi:hypothetical protein
MITPQFEKEWQSFSANVNGTTSFKNDSTTGVEKIYRVAISKDFVHLVWSDVPEPGKGARTIAKTEFWVLLKNRGADFKVISKDWLVKIVTYFQPKCMSGKSLLDDNFVILSKDCTLIHQISDTLLQLLIGAQEKDLHLQTVTVGENHYLVLTVNELIVDQRLLVALYNHTHKVGVKINDFS